MPLYGACAQGNTHGARILLDHGADIHDNDVSTRFALQMPNLDSVIRVVRFACTCMLMFYRIRDRPLCTLHVQMGTWIL